MCVLLKKKWKKMRFLYATKDCVYSSHYMVKGYRLNILYRDYIYRLLFGESYE